MNDKNNSSDLFVVDDQSNKDESANLSENNSKVQEQSMWIDFLELDSKNKQNDSANDTMPLDLLESKDQNNSPSLGKQDDLFDLFDADNQSKQVEPEKQTS